MVNLFRPTMVKVTGFSKLSVEVQQEYFNTTLSLWLVEILKVLIRINELDCVLILHLYLPIDEND
jgi:hypothetical protein